MIQSFTGPSRLTLTQERWAANVLRSLNETPSERRSGGAHGLDSIVAWETPIGSLTLVVPDGKWWNDTLLGIPEVRVERISGGYRARNEALVEGSDVLHAFLKSEDFYRSGEWMTVNIAGRAGVPVVKHILPA